MLALPVEPGLKTDAERFAGAIDTITCEVMIATARRCRPRPATGPGGSDDPGLVAVVARGY